MLATEVITETNINAESPSRLPTPVFDALVKLIASGGEVPIGNIESILSSSPKVAWIQESNKIIAVRVLKKPNASYRDRVFAAAGVQDQARKYNLELGYNYVLPEFRQKGISGRLGAFLLERSPLPVYATVRLDNSIAIAGLKRLGFIQLGNDYPSSRGDYRLSLWGQANISENITESLSRVVYHYTNVSAAAKIVAQGQFELASSLGSVETEYAPPGQPYFLSTTRTKLGGYHESIGDSGVLFVLDGNYYNQRYRSAPVDYWQNRNPTVVHHRAHEAEDRIFSREHTLPIDGVSAIHIYAKPMSAQDREKWSPSTPGYVRKILLAAKLKGIPAYLYEDIAAWRQLDTSKAVAITRRETLTGPENTRGGTRRHRGYMLPWLELLQATDKNRLSKKASDLVYDLQYRDMYTQDRIRGLSTDLSNARKPNSGPDRESAIKIIKIMQQNKWPTVADLVAGLVKKWKKPDDNT